MSLVGIYPGRASDEGRIGVLKGRGAGFDGAYWNLSSPLVGDREWAGSSGTTDKDVLKLSLAMMTVYNVTKTYIFASLVILRPILFSFACFTRY